MDVTTNPVTSIAATVAVSGGEVTGDTGEYIPLTDILMRNKFKLYNRTRQSITGDCKRSIPLRPGAMVQDNRRDNEPFIIMGYSFRPMTDSYTVTLQEYDNTTPVTLTITETITTG